jgi:5-methylcytosine-specific restriction endonuclease McrA
MAAGYRVRPCRRTTSNSPGRSEARRVGAIQGQLTVSETHEKFKRAQDLLRHSVPNGDPAIIFERAITLLVAELERRKTGTAATDRPRATRRENRHSRYIPAAVKRTVWQRDGGRCAFKGRQGRCTETGFLEYHHVVPFADGGESSAGNLELRCRSHNAYEAEKWCGSAEMPLLRERRACDGTRAQLGPERVK